MLSTATPISRDDFRSLREGLRQWTLRVLVVVAAMLPAAALAADDATRGAAPAAAPPPVRIEAADGALTARLVVDPPRPSLGVAVELVLEADVPPEPGLEIVFPDLRDVLTEALGEHVVEVETVRLAPDRRSVSARLRLYDEGAHELPPLAVSLRRGEQVLATVELSGAVLHVEVAVAEDAEPVPARAAMPLMVPPAPFPWLPVSAAAVLVAALIVSLLLWRRRARVEPPAPPPPPAHEKALAALRTLASRALLERGEVEPYFVELSEILRTYLEDRFALRAPEQTTEEFLAAVSQTDEGRRAIEAAHRDLLRDFLTRADLVKFARARPAAAECAAAGSSAEQFVRQTALAPAEPESVA